MPADYAQSLSGFEALPEAHGAQLWPEAHPFLLSEPPAEAIVIGLHGYRATPHEIRPVLQACREAGLDAVSLLFAGHGFADLPVQRAALRQMYPRALEQAVVHEVARCRALGYRRVYLYGHSMGGAMALRVAAETPVDAVAVTAPALILPLRALLVHLLPAWLDLTLAHGIVEGGDDYRYRFDTTFSILKLKNIARRARESLGAIECPVFVAQAGEDRTVPARVGELLEAQAHGSVTRRCFEHSDHAMTTGDEAATVAEAVAEFLASQA